MFDIRLAGLRIRIENRYSFIERQCRDYCCDEGEVAFSVSVSNEEILEEQKHGEFSEDYCESVCMYRNICEKIAFYNVFLLHSSVIEVDGRAYAFAAKSGVGKSTHTSLWLKNIPGARVLNGDKPLYRVEEDGSITVFGTPWNGKEGYGKRGTALLSGIAFLERGEDNSYKSLKTSEGLVRFMGQIYMNKENPFVLTRTLRLADKVLSEVPLYELRCNMDISASECAAEAFGIKEL